MSSFWKPFFPGRLIILCGFFFSMAACAPTTSHLMRDEALHVNQYPGKEAMAIDGLWKNAWGDIARIEKGRMYLVDFVYPMVVMSDFEREAPGVYRANSTGSNMIPGEEFTLTIIAEDKLLLESAVTDRVYYKIQLDHPRLYSDELAASLAAARDSKSIPSPLEISRLSLTPQWVRPGEMFDLSIDFSAYEPLDAETIPVTLTYFILSDGRTLYESTPTLMEAENGKSMTKTIHLKAAKSTGAYQIRTELSTPGARAEKTADFEISMEGPAITGGSAGGSRTILSDRNAVLDGLSGEWEIVISGYPPYPMRIERQGDQLTGVIEDFSGWQVKEAEFRLEKTVLIIQSRLSNPSLNCWLTAEDTIELNEELDAMPVRSKVLEGNQCVSIGEIFKGTMRRAGNGMSSTDNIMSAPSNMVGYSKQINSVHYFKVTGRTNGQVYGTDIYTSDSHLGTAVVHAGILKPGQTGVVKITMLPGSSRYTGSTRNSVQSRSYGQWGASYSVSLAEDY